ncbi:glycosyltransferase family 2 protein [Prochlorothrix hollandica]|uniref:glycosyltransferase family 2 protein n=1 Tax=Prochlorothrix hollandica TaxID=1223 RepID=UPI0003449DAC|nr:glycosyltransferase family 2 protein [Prochlorothrix hollandica]
MLVTIITVCFNSVKDLEKCINSVIKQNSKDIEYVVVDGNSQDGTSEILHTYANVIDKLIIEPDEGIYNAMNKALNLASGDYIYFLGSDDYLIDEFVIDDVINFIHHNHLPLFIYGNIKVFPNTGEAYVHKPAKPDKVLDEMITGCLPHQASFAHKSLFQNEEVGLFNENYKSAADYEWFLKLWSFADKISDDLVYYDRTIASYNSNGTSSNLTVALAEMFKSQNNLPLYQSSFWTQRRIAAYQNIIIHPNGHWDLQRSPSTVQDYQNLLLQHQELHEEYRKLTELAQQLLIDLNNQSSHNSLFYVLIKLKKYFRSLFFFRK